MTYFSENAEIRYVWECISLKMLKKGMKDLFCGKGIYFIEIAEIRYVWGFISLKRPKEGITGNLFY